jgi:hypothetical protein
MSDQSAVETIVRKAMPGMRIVEAAKAAATRGGDLKRGVHKAPKLDVMQRKTARAYRGAGVADAKRALKVAKKGPSGIVYVTPKNSDGLAVRSNAKAVVVSHGKVIAVQG